MSTSYTDVFTGKNVTAAFPQYSAISLTNNITLSWPAEFQNTNDVVSVTMDITPSADGFSVTMPDATLGSTGTAFIINNPSAYSFTLLTNTSTDIVTITAGTANLIWLIDNTTQAGTWRNLPAFGGGSAVTSVGASSDSTNLVITGTPGLPITTGGTINFSLQDDLLALTQFGISTGLAVRRAANTWDLVSILQTANQIVVTDGDGVAGNPTIALAPNISGVSSITLSGLAFGVATNNTIASTATNAAIILSPNGTGSVNFDGNANLLSGNKLIFNATSGGGSLSLIAGSTSANQALIWPTSVGTAGQLLSNTDGAGTLGWTSVATFPGESTLNAVARYSNTVGGLKDSPDFIVTDIGAATGLTSCTIADIFIGTINPQTITTSGTVPNQDIVIAPQGNGGLTSLGNITIKTSNTFKRGLHLFDTPGTFYSGFQAAEAMAGDIIWSLPVADEVGLFSSDGAGNMSISTAISLTSLTVGDITISGNTILDSTTSLTLTSSGTDEIIATNNFSIKTPSGTSWLKLYNASGIYSGIAANESTTLNLVWRLPIVAAVGYLQSDIAGNMSVLALTTASTNIPQFTNTTGTIGSSPISVSAGGALTGVTSSTFSGMNIGVTSNTIATLSNANLNLAPNGTGIVASTSDISLLLASSALKLRLYNTAGTFYAGLGANATMAANKTWLLPATDGAAYMRSDGAGNLSFTALTTANNQFAIYGDTAGTLSAGAPIYTNSSGAIGLTSNATLPAIPCLVIPAAGFGGIPSGGTDRMYFYCRPGTAGNATLCYAGTGAAGVSTSASAVVTNKIQIKVNDVIYYLLASTSAT